jgi:hypothetical protein
MHVQSDQIIIRQHFRNHDLELWMRLLHRANELNKAVWPVDHIRIVLAVGELDVSTGGFVGLLLVDCKFIEFRY